MTQTADRTADPGDPLRRLSRLLDPGTGIPLAEAGGSGVLTMRGLVGGTRVVAFGTDATTMGGAVGAAGCGRIVQAIDTAVRNRCPVLGIWHCAGARLTEGAAALEGVGQVFAAMVRASGRVPQLSIVVGPAAGGSAYGPPLTDLVIMAPAGRMFVTGPDVPRHRTGEQADTADPGGAQSQARRSAVVHVTAESEADAYRRARGIVGLLARPGVFDPRAVRGADDLRTLVPERLEQAYDVKPLLHRLLDPGVGFEELQPGWAANIVVGLGRLGGRTVGVVANNPLHQGGCLDSRSAEKAARFVRMCDSFGVALLVVVDVPGYLPGGGQESDGALRRGATLLHAFAEALVPRVTLVTRRSYGGAYLAMNSRALGATAVFAWPGAETAVIGAGAAEDHERTTGGLHRALSIGAVDEIIEPAQTRRKLAEALAAAPAGRGAHGNIPL